MLGLPLAFISPWILLALASLPVIWWFLRLTPPKPQEEVFPPTRILARLAKQSETPAQSPWWLTLLRLTMAALVILAMAGPILNPQEQQLKSADGPLMLVFDDGWASAENWENRKVTATQLAREAQENGQAVILQSTTERINWPTTPLPAIEAISLIEAADNLAVKPAHDLTAKRISTGISANTPGQIFWLSDGLTREGSDKLQQALASAEVPVSVAIPDTDSLLTLSQIRNEPSQLFATVTRPGNSDVQEVIVSARDKDGVVIARSKAAFESSSTTAEAIFSQPVEIRNEITRLEIEEVENAAAVQLLDENNQRRLIGLVSGENHDLSQPLLSPLYYISRALEPFSDLRRADNANATASVPDLINQGVSAIMLADVGLLDDETTQTLNKWIAGGGLLVRFAGPRLAASPDGDLLPVDIRPGDRNLGGALSWETPKPLAAFTRESPFFGIDPPRNVLVTKQLLALQETRLEEKTWAILEDGTPLVTAEKRGSGWLVLFHVGSDATWSNLPLSGTFVEMLRRISSLSRSTGQAGTDKEDIALPPLRILDGKGKFSAPDISIKPLVLVSGQDNKASLENPPGIYGTSDGYTALNLFEGKVDLNILDISALGEGFETLSYASDEKLELKSWLLILAAVLLILDCIAVLWMSGAIRLPRRGLRSASQSTSSVLAIVILIGTLIYSAPTNAQEIDFTAALRTRLAYVITGVPEVDRLSKAGMRGLTVFITNRTALEPAEPIGLNISQDELSFYSLLYWPIDPKAAIPDAATMARIDSFMKQGGSVLFDTRDQVSGVFGGTFSSPAARTLQLILTNLDIPPLEPVPSDHVLTKAFYLLDSFPGRFSGGDLWVEALPDTPQQTGRPARAGDGVSSILITSNDLAGAWAVDQSLRPLLPTIPPDPIQRNYAFRAGVNLMMYTLTGNYKADQVHLPALLERLGQ